MKYVRRTGFTYVLNNPDGTKRPRRGLFWMKKIYKEWFEYAKLSSYGVPEEFGNLEDFDDFEVWWKHPDYGFELFCEPEQREPLEVVKEIESSKHINHLRIDLTGDPSKIKLMFKRFLDKNLVPNNKLVSHARFQPSKPQARIKIPSLQKYRETYIQREILGMSRGDVIEKRMLPPQAPYQSNEERKIQIHDIRKDEELLRSISREVQKAKQIMKNIKKGTFP
jgi:hypothetical protein